MKVIFSLFYKAKRLKGLNRCLAICLVCVTLLTGGCMNTAKNCYDTVNSRDIIPLDTLTKADTVKFSSILDSVKKYTSSRSSNLPNYQISKFHGSWYFCFLTNTSQMIAIPFEKDLKVKVINLPSTENLLAKYFISAEDSIINVIDADILKYYKYELGKNDSLTELQNLNLKKYFSKGDFLNLDPNYPNFISTASDLFVPIGNEHGYNYINREPFLKIDFAKESSEKFGQYPLCYTKTKIRNNEAYLKYTAQGSFLLFFRMHDAMFAIDSIQTTETAIPHQCGFEVYNNPDANMAKLRKYLETSEYNIITPGKTGSACFVVKRIKKERIHDATRYEIFKIDNRLNVTSRIAYNKEILKVFNYKEGILIVRKTLDYADYFH
jgi:hypothetical protein